MRFFCTLAFVATTAYLLAVEPMPERMTSLYSEGLSAASKKDFIKAKSSFIELLKEPDLPLTTCEEAHLQIIKADIALQNFGPARLHIQELLKQDLMPFMLFRTKIELASLEFAEKNLKQAASVLKELEKICPLEDWPLENRVLYVTIKLLAE